MTIVRVLVVQTGKKPARQLGSRNNLLSFLQIKGLSPFVKEAVNLLQHKGLRPQANEWDSGQLE